MDNRRFGADQFDEPNRGGVNAQMNQTRQQQTSARLVVLTNIPTPYRTHFFNRLATALRSHNVDLEVAYCAKTEWHRSWAFVPEENLYRYRFFSETGLRIRNYTLHLNLAVIRFIQETRPTWLLSAGAWNMPTGMLALTLQKRYNFISIFWSEGHADAVINRDGPIAWFRRSILRRYRAFAVPNDRSASFLRQELGNSIALMELPNTVDDEFYRPPTSVERTDARARFGLNPAERVFLQVAQLENRKGVLELVEAFISLTSEHRKIKLVLIGAGSLESAIRSRWDSAIRDNRLILTGALVAEEVRRWLFAGDFAILASRRDPNPLSTIEAGLCGRVLILTRYVGNCDELLGRNPTPFRIEVVAPAEIKAALSMAVSAADSTLRHEGEKIAERASLQFSSTRVANSFAEALIRLRP